MKQKILVSGRRILAAILAAAVLFACCYIQEPTRVSAAPDNTIQDSMDFGTMKISGGGFVSSIVTGKKCVYARTDVGGAYRYNEKTKKWEQLLDFLGDKDRGLLSVDAMCIDPQDDTTIYLLCGCAYFSDARTVIMRSRDGGASFDEIDVTDLIQVHGNGYGRQFGEAIAVSPNDSNIIYCGGDTQGLIMSKDGGDTWTKVKGYDKLDLFQEEINWPTWTEHKVKATGEEYYKSNGVSAIAMDDSKVYVATTVKDQVNIHVADIGSDDFQPLSEELPTKYYPSRINKDADGNLLITYTGSISFDGKSGGGAYRYNVKTGEVTDISPCENGLGAVSSEPHDSSKLIATTCGMWNGQLWGKDDWEENKVVWGDVIYKSDDGGKNWTQMSPGQTKGWEQPLQANYLQDGGSSWIRYKAIHWSGAIVFDPNDENRFFVTSGNGVFSCDDVWADIPTIAFHADGIEEVVALDGTCAPDGTFYSVIGDYDGFVHTSKTSSYQYSPTMDSICQNSSCGAIAYCPSNPDIMVRYSESQSGAFYSKDAGKTWSKLATNNSGGKAAIAETAPGKYRIFQTGNGTISYTDNFGESWQQATGTKGSSPLWVQVEESNPQYVYAYGYYYNQYHGKKEPTIEDAYYTLMVSDDYGKTFQSQVVCQYDQCDNAYRIAYLAAGEFVIAAGYYGAYYVSDYGKTITKLDSVEYCKTIGSGAAQNAGDKKTLYMWGRPKAADPEGVYRSTDAGKTWVAVDIDHTYGGTGNGNFLVGDQKEFGTFYMSTVGCGIVYGKLKNGTSGSTTTEKPDTTTRKIIITTEKPQTTTTQEPAVTTQEPVVTTQEPAVTTQEPAVTTQEPAVTTQEPAVTTQEPAVTTQEPAVTTQEPAVTTQEPAVTTQKPTATTRKPATTQKPAATTRKPATTQKPAATTRKPATTQRPGGSTQEPSVTTQRPGSSTQEPSVTTQRPGSSTQEPSVTTQRPGSSTQEPSVTTQRPGSSTQEPSVTTQRPGSSTQEPSVTTQRPGSSTQEPSVTTQRPGSSTQEPSVTTQKPATDATGSGTQPAAGPVPDLQNNQQQNIAVSRILLLKDEITVCVKKSSYMLPVVFPANATDQKIHYVSSDPAVVTVTEDGWVTGKEAGVATVIAFTANGCTASCKVTVIPGSVQKLRQYKSKGVIRWKKQSGVTGYKIYIAQNKKKKFKLYRTTKKPQVVVPVQWKKGKVQMKVCAYKKFRNQELFGKSSRKLKIK